MEQVDVVVVGGRLAGCAVAAPLARAGKRVVVIDRMAFPSDQLSTHLLQPSGTSELAKMGALPRILALSPSQVRWTTLTVDGVTCRERLRPAPDGIDFGVCIPRDQQDVCLVEAAREQGADVRERCTFEDLTWRAGRVSGLRYRDASGERHEIGAALVVGADGRRSSVAAAVGAWAPYRLSQNGRGLVFRYVDDPRAGAAEAETNYQWREGDSFALAFPSSPVGRLLVLFQGHRDETSEARKDPEGYWERKLTQHPGLRERLRGVDPASYTKLRSAGEVPAFFRASSGPGWALAGDAGHFKDPVTGQGMRDAMWAGRELAEHVLPALDRGPAAVDAATRRWEHHRDRHCLSAYHFANMDTTVEAQPPALLELVRESARGHEQPDLTDLFGRARDMQEIAPIPRLVRSAVAAFARGERPRGQTVVTSVKVLRTQLEIRRERHADRFRSTRAVYDSDHAGASWPSPPAVRPRVLAVPEGAVPGAPVLQEVPA
ncbi:MAG: Monooxygenase [Solirubrobacterales bacterium]|nr:Monooxygenase [Solirubrobacterales bacterium]